VSETRKQQKVIPEIKKNYFGDFLKNRAMIESAIKFFQNKIMTGMVLSMVEEVLNLRSDEGLNS